VFQCKNGTPAGQKGKKLYDAVAKEFAKNCKVSFRCKRLGKTTEALTNKKSDASSSKVKQRRMLKQCSARGTLRKKITNLQGQKQRETICEERTQKLTLFSRGVGKYFDHWQPLYKLSFSVRKIVMKALAELRKPQVESNIEEEVKKSLNLRLPRIKVEKVVEEEITLEEPDVGNELLAMPNLESSAGNPETVKTVESVVDGENASVVLEPPLNLDGTAEEGKLICNRESMLCPVYIYLPILRSVPTRRYERAFALLRFRDFWDTLYNYLWNVIDVVFFFW